MIEVFFKIFKYCLYSLLSHHLKKFVNFSNDTLNSHVNGVKHIKKKIAMETKNDEKRSKGYVPETKVVRQVS